MEKTAYFYGAEDIMELFHISRSGAYKLIQQLNEELESQGYLTVSGRISISYFRKRYFCEEIENKEKPQSGGLE